MHYLLHVQVQEVKRWKIIFVVWKNLEEISESYDGVEKSYAIQAGREVRIIVKPDEIDDTECTSFS